MFEHENLELMIKLKSTSKKKLQENYLDISWQILETL